MRYIITKWLFFLRFVAIVAQTALAQSTSITLNSNELYDLNDPTIFLFQTQLTINSLVGSNWNSDSIIHETKRAVKIWEQCGLKFNTVTINFLDVASRYLNLNDKEALYLTNTYLRNETTRPVVFMVHEIEGVASVGYSYREQRDFGNNNILRGTIWLPDNILTNDYVSARDPEYSTLAHELAHVLLNLGHTSIRNILGNSPKVVNAHISHDQCIRLRMSSYVKKI